VKVEEGFNMNPAFIIGSIIGLMLLRSRMENTSEGETVKEPWQSLNNNKVANSNNLTIEAKLRVSGLEKALSASPNREKILADIVKASKINHRYAPKLIGETPAVSIKSTSSGFTITVVWPAEWSSNKPGNIREPVRLEYLNNFLRTASGQEVKNRITSFRMYRD
jgi:hypothetical protein